MGLPVLHLPHVVFDNVYKSLDVSDIILLSQCSKRVRDLVRSQEGPRTARQVAICFHNECTRVQVVRRIKDDFSRLFALEVLPSVKNRELTDETSFFNLDVDGTTWDVKKCPPSMEGDWYCVPEEGCCEKDVLILVQMLKNLFNCSIFLIHLEPTNFNFQKLFVETDALHRADTIYIDEHQFAPEEMDFMFDHFVTDFLCFCGNGGPEYNYQKSLNFPKVDLEHATWINLEKVFEMAKTSKYVRLHEAKLIGDGDINQFIKWWLTSDTKCLEFLIIARGHNSSPPSPGVEVRMNRSVLLEGFESTPGKKKREEVTKGLSHIQWKDGVDIVRKDGVQATILVHRQTPYDKFVLAVWHHPNPNVEEVTDN